MGNTLNVYPNPAINQINIHLEKGVDIARVSIVDIQGREVLSDLFSGEYTKVDISNLSNGLYVVKVETNNETIVQKVMIR